MWNRVLPVWLRLVLCPSKSSTIFNVSISRGLTLQLQELQEDGGQRPGEAKVQLQFDEALEATALNDHRSDEILAWGCIVRHVLSRAANGRHVVTGLPQGSLSPHHPVAHGEEESAWMQGCMNAWMHGCMNADLAVSVAKPFLCQLSQPCHLCKCRTCITDRDAFHC